MTQYYTVMTTIGIQKLAAAQAGGPRVQISEMAIGDSRREPSPEYTALENEKWRGPINQLKVDSANPHWIIAETHVPADVGGWMVREVGLFDTDGDLIVIGRQPDTYKPNLNEGTAKELVIKMIAEVSNSELVELTIDPSVVMASKQYVDDKFHYELKVEMEQFEKDVIKHIEGLQFQVDMNSKGLQRLMIEMELDGKIDGGTSFFNDFSGSPKNMKVLKDAFVLTEPVEAGETSTFKMKPLFEGAYIPKFSTVTVFDDEGLEDVLLPMGTDDEEASITVADVKNNYKVGAIVTLSTLDDYEYIEGNVEGELIE